MSLLLLVTLAAACGASSPSSYATAVVETPAGEVELDIEVADTLGERRRGLMGRTSLPERAGMLFRFDEDTRSAFIMKDTLIPLSIAFLGADGRILTIIDMEPCHSDPCPTYGPGIPYRTALEVNQGAFDRLGVVPGDRVRVR